MKQQISNIIIAAMLSGSALYGFGVFEKKEANYATVNFDGGFKKIGEIAEQSTFSDFKVTFNNNEVYSGDIDRIIEDLKLSLEQDKEQNFNAWKDGVRIKGRTGIKWVGSEGTFELTTDQLDQTSTEKAPIDIAEMIGQLKKMDAEVKANHKKYAEQALAFSENPKNSFILSKLASAFK